MLSSLLRLGFAACLLLLPPLSASALASAQAQGAASHREKAMQLARTVHPQELALATAAKGMEEQLLPALLKQPDMAKMEAEHPGVLKAMFAAAHPLLLEVERLTSAQVQEALAGLYVNEFSTGEIDVLQRFYSSPTGRKVILGMFAPAAMQGAVEALAADPDAPISERIITDGRSKAASAMAMQMSPEDVRAMEAFVSSPVGARVQALAPKVDALVLKIANAPVPPDLQGKVDAAMVAVAEKFIAAKSSR